MELRGERISFRYGKGSPWILKDVDISIRQGERIALVGPSGYGKSTLAKILAGYITPTKGRVVKKGWSDWKKQYDPVQLIYQHPEQAVNPRWKLGKSLAEAWKVDSGFREKMGIEEQWYDRWPNELSGGELQRFAIGRALSPDTRFLICDEITTMLDPITQAKIWSLILERASQQNIGLLVVTHNMTLAKKVCEKIISLPEHNGI